MMLACAGCGTVREARRVQSSEEWRGERRSTAAGMGLLPGGVFSLAELESLAHDRHPEISGARAAVEAARQRCKMVGAGRWPQVSASAGYGRATGNVRGMPRSSSTRGDWSGSIGLDLLLYDFGRTRAEERRSLEALVAAEERLREALLEVTFELRAAFFERSRAAHLLEVALEGEKQFAAHLEEARSMADVGMRRPYDVTKAEVDLGNARLSAVAAGNALAIARARLNRALGLAEDADFELGEGGLEAPAGTVDELMGHARRNAPALAIAHAEERAASAYVDQMIAELYPGVSLGAEAGASGGRFPLVWNFSGLVRAVQNVFDGRGRTARIKEAVAQLRMARSAIETAEQELYLALVSGVAEMERARKSAEIADMLRKQAEDSLDIVNEQFRVGVSSSIERTDAQVALIEARANAINAGYDSRSAAATLLRLIGATESGQEL